MKNDLGNNIGADFVLSYLRKSLALNTGRAKMG
jgi:hypothetical protein